jgi:hypothetical protein
MDRRATVKAVCFAFLIPSFLLTKVIGKNLESMPIIGWSLLIGGVVMWIIDAAKAKSEAAGPGAPSSSIRTWKMDAMRSLAHTGKTRGARPLGVDYILRRDRLAVFNQGLR